jgi:uncharacterized protein
MTSPIAKRLEAVPWDEVSEAMTRDGYAATPTLLTEAECANLITSYSDDKLFRSRVVMARFGFGRGEYKYFNNPLPDLVHDLRQELYPRLAPVANRWAEEIGGSSYPKTYNEFLNACHTAGQTKPTPLILRYESGDYNCLHQDLYGELAFPFQLTFFLSRPQLDYSGGEFVLVEQRPRMQSRATVLTPDRGQAVIFPTRYRSVQGTRGPYKANLRHGVSPVRSGLRFTLGIIFHDAK